PVRKIAPTSPSATATAAHSSAPPAQPPSSSPPPPATSSPSPAKPTPATLVAGIVATPAATSSAPGTRTPSGSVVLGAARLVELPRAGDVNPLTVGAAGAMLIGFGSLVRRRSA